MRARLKQRTWGLVGLCIATQPVWSQSTSLAPAFSGEPTFVSAPEQPESAASTDLSGRWVVLAESVTVRRGPSTSATGVLRLVRGSELLVAAREGEWLAVSIPEEETRGWIPAASVERADIVAAGAAAFIERLKQQRHEQETSIVQDNAETAPTMQAKVKTAEAQAPLSGQGSPREGTPAAETAAIASETEAVEATPTRARSPRGGSMSYLRAFAVPIFTFIR